MPTKTVEWAVYDLEAETVIGVWKEYKQAETFWADGLEGNQTNWFVCPAEEVC